MPPVDLAIPVFGDPNHISLDRGFGFIRKWSRKWSRQWSATDAAADEGRRLRDGLLDKTNTASSVWADTAYRSAANEEFMERNGSSAMSIVRGRRGARWPCCRKASVSVRFWFHPLDKGGRWRPLDLLVLPEDSGPMGCALSVRLIGAIEAEQKEKGVWVRNDRLLGVATRAHVHANVK